jgi:hypothetical protein
MPLMGFEPTAPVFEGANTVHGLLRSHCDRRPPCNAEVNKDEAVSPLPHTSL